MDVKEPKPFEEQLNKLIGRGCEIADYNHALRVINSVNYYRLSAYFLPFKKKDGSYVDGTTFNNVYRIYEFDRKLRGLLFTVIEEIELMLRVQLSYHHAHKYGSLGYMDKDNFNKYHKHEYFIEHINKAIENNKNQLFVKHHLEKYDGKFPTWVIIELFTVGELSFFYSDMHVYDKKEIAKTLFNTTHFNVSSWLLCLTDLRNYCAHYARLYYGLFPAIPQTPKNFPYTLKKRIFDYILVLKFLYPDPIKWKNEFIISLDALILEYSDCIQMEHIGFPENWRQILKEANPKLKHTV